MSQTMFGAGEVRPGLFAGDLPFFDESQAWKFASHGGMRWPGDEPGFHGVLYRVIESGNHHGTGYPKTPEEKLIYNGLVWNKPPEHEAAVETGVRSAMESFAEKLTGDEITQHALGILSVKVDELEQPLRADRHLRMAEIIHRQRGNYYVMGSFSTSSRPDGWEQGSFAKLWGLSIDEDHRPEPVVVGKDNIISRLEPWQLMIGTMFLFKHANG